MNRSLMEEYFLSKSKALLEPLIEGSFLININFFLKTLIYWSSDNLLTTIDMANLLYTLKSLTENLLLPFPFGLEFPLPLGFLVGLFSVFLVCGELFLG